MLGKRDNWTLEDSLYDFMAQAVKEKALQRFEENKEAFNRIFDEYLSPEMIKECLDCSDFQSRLEDEIREMMTPIIRSRIVEIGKALSQ